MWSSECGTGLRGSTWRLLQLVGDLLNEDLSKAASLSHSALWTWSGEGGQGLCSFWEVVFGANTIGDEALPKADPTKV